MSDSILLGFGHYMITVPRFIWKIPISRQTKKFEADLAFMSAEHHLVRNFLVRELARSGESISEERIADELKLSINRLRFILDDLEKHMTFLCRDSDRAINWAYPVTVEKTPHSVTYDTGEQGYAA